jgi:hypothetical protein
MHHREFCLLEDAKALAKPWDVLLGFSLPMEWSIIELACTDNAAFLDFEITKPASHFNLNQEDRTLEVLSRSLRRERPEVCRDRDDVVLRKVRNHFLHWCHSRASARSILNANQLPGYINRL